MADVPPPQQPKKRPKKPPPATERADLATLYCLQATARCALDGCAVCAHRICQHGAPGRPLPPAQRPESCPRVVDESPGPDLGQLYGGCRVLTVGDGDLSFSVALAERGECASLTASTLEPDLEALQREYDGLDVRGHARRIDDVRYGVDARRLAFPSASFDRIVFNFPCLPVSDGKDGNSEGSGKADASAIEENKALVRAFVRSAVPLLAPGGEIHIAHKTKEPFSWWGFPDLVSHALLTYRGALVFDRAAYQPYANRKARDKKSFSAIDAVVYVYARDGAGAPPTLPPLASSNGAPSSFYEGALPPARDVVTSRRVCRVVRLDTELMARVREASAAASSSSSSKKRRKKR
jgi:25S rRNA (uracil2634-N3)-methyltransferase